MDNNLVRHLKMIQTEKKLYGRVVRQRKEHNSFSSWPVCLKVLLRSLVLSFYHLRFLRFCSYCGKFDLNKLASIQRQFVSWSLCDATDAEAIGVCGHVSRAQKLLHNHQVFRGILNSEIENGANNSLQWDNFHPKLHCVNYCLWLSTFWNSCENAFFL